MGGVLDRGIERDRLGLAGQDHGDTVVDFFQKLIGLGGDDRARADRFALWGVDLSNKSHYSMELALGCCATIIRVLPYFAVVPPETAPHARRTEVSSQGASTRIE